MLKIKDWLQLKNNAQFSPLCENQTGFMSSVLRIKDKREFHMGMQELSAAYSARFLYVTIIEFKKDLVHVELTEFSHNGDIWKKIAPINEIQLNEDGKILYINAYSVERTGTWSKAGIGIKE